MDGNRPARLDRDGATGGGAEPAVPSEPPAGKRAWFARRPQEWKRMAAALMARADLGANARNAYSRIYAAEGGLTPNACSEAVAGIMPGTLRRLRGRGRAGLALIDAAHVFRAYDAYFDDVFAGFARALGAASGSAVLDRIGDRDTAAALADVLFREGGPKGSLIVQRAVNDVIARLDPAECCRLGLAPLRLDGRFGPLTFAACCALAANGHAAALRGAIADRRTALRPGERARNDSFR